MQDKNVKVIVLSELLESRARKEKELQYYCEQLKELQVRMNWIQAEISLTTRIIDMIEKEKIFDMEKYLKERNDG